ncbi:hypothetical protein EVAR_54801_1 [Eumeta japonica]|uniref:Uncharacterized protein n=1 Tax=Eumeta variegata TaxID=151549 RepID=A0A4C1Y3G7_EUMVA|nr:hypothetical protein EVAR_54801_1 [Eumeta japonica]
MPYFKTTILCRRGRESRARIETRIENETVVKIKCEIGVDNKSLIDFVQQVNGLVQYYTLTEYRPEVIVSAFRPVRESSGAYSQSIHNNSPPSALSSLYQSTPPSIRYPTPTEEAASVYRLR